MTTERPLRIALVAPPFLPIPPPGYAGTERVVATLAQTLHARGHHVTVFCSGDSQLPCEVVPVVPEAVWSRGERGWGIAWVEMAVARAWEEAGRFDLIHAHVDTSGFLMARYCPTPVVTTLHGRLDTGGCSRTDRPIPRDSVDRHQREPATVEPGRQLGRDNSPRARLRVDAVERDGRRLSPLHRPDHAREGRDRGDRGRSPSAHAARHGRQGPRAGRASTVRRGRATRDRRRGGRLARRGRRRRARPS